MAEAYNTSSTLDWDTGVNKTSTAVSTNIIIKVGSVAVGAIQSLQVKEDRSIKMIDEVGTDGHIDSVPTASTNITGSCSRIRFDRLRVTEAFSRGFLHISSQVYPFDILILDKQKRDESQWVSTVIKNVWITSLDYTFNVSEWIITDNMSWQAETIYSHLSTSGNKNAAQGGERQIVSPGVWDNAAAGSAWAIERAVDRNADRRGSLDAAGLIDIGRDGGLF